MKTQTAALNQATNSLPKASQANTSPCRASYNPQTNPALVQSLLSRNNRFYISACCKFMLLLFDFLLLIIYTEVVSHKCQENSLQAVIKDILQLGKDAARSYVLIFSFTLAIIQVNDKTNVMHVLVKSYCM